MAALLQQFKERRKNLGLKQADMMLRVGMSRQQYQHLESKGNPRLNTLELIAKGLKGELMLIPQEKLNAVKAALASESSSPKKNANASTRDSDVNEFANDPWKGIQSGDE